MPDELRYAIRRELFLQPAQEAITMRNDMTQTALPMRDYGSFLPGAGVGGAGVHWNGHTWRFLLPTLPLKTHLTQRYGAKKLDGLTIQDWGVTLGRNRTLLRQVRISLPAPRARPGSSRAWSSRAATRLKGRAPANIPIRR